MARLILAVVAWMALVGTGTAAANHDPAVPDDAPANRLTYDCTHDNGDGTATYQQLRADPDPLPEGQAAGQNWVLTPVPEGITVETVRFDLADLGLDVQPSELNPDQQPFVVGCLAHPTGVTPEMVVSITHGIGHSVQLSWTQHTVGIVERARQAGVDVAVLAINYRDNFGFPTLRGAHDIAAATRATLTDRGWVPERGLVMFSVSMGASVGGTALTLGDTSPWDVWIDVEGVSDVAETYTEAALIALSGNATGQAAKDGVERDAGHPGTPPTAEEFLVRSPLFHAVDMAAKGVTQAAVVHSVNDGLVGYHQGQSMATALCTAQIPTTFDTITEGDGFRPDSTGTGLVGLGEVNEATVNLPGHASEADPAHPVMTTAFDRLHAYVETGTVGADGCLGILAAQPTTGDAPAPDPDQPGGAPGPDSPEAADAGGTLPATGSESPVPVLLAAVLAAVGLGRLARGRSGGRGRGDQTSGW